MSRQFSKSTSNYMSLGAAAVGSLLSGASGSSFHAWAYATTLTATNDRNFLLVVRGSTGVTLGLSVHDGSSAVLRTTLRSRSADSASILFSTGTVSTGAWTSVGLSINYATAGVAFYINGSAAGTGTATFGSTTYSHSVSGSADSIGSVAGTATADQQWDGLVAHAAVWKTVLSGSEFSDLAAGANPGAIQTASLVSLHRLAGVDSPEPNAVSGGPSGTITGSVPAGGSDPGVWVPWRARTTRSIGVGRYA